ncbi:MAG: HAMP domain-containing sensor histidine kinase [Pseudomonadota bacterium]
MNRTDYLTSFVTFLLPQRLGTEGLENALLREQQLRVSSATWLAAIVSVINGAAIYSTFLLTGTTPLSHGWFALVLLSALYLGRLYMSDRKKLLPATVSGYYMQRAEYGSILLGLIWGLGVYAADPGTPVTALFVFVVVVAMATGFCALTASAPRISLRFSIPCFGVGSSYFLIQGGPVATMTGTLIFVLLLALVIGGYQSKAHLQEHVRSLSDAERATRNLDDAIEAIGDAFAIYAPDGKLDRTNSRFRFYFPKGLDLRNLRDGEIFRLNDDVWLLRSLVPMEDGRTVCLHKDVTSLKHRESQLISARREAEDANTAKARFMSTMSHELRTPLNIINGFSKIMSSSSKVIVTASEMREYSDSMLDAGEHLLSVINDIIEFSQVGSDRFIHEPAPEDVRELLSKSISLSAKFQAIDDISGIDVTVASNFGDLVVDEATFRRVLMSLMSNALKFGGQPTRMVVRAFLRPDGCPVISIRDFGPGIEASELERVFEPFYQGEGLRSGQFAGTGLGLPLARELMRLHGGRVELASRPGVGTTASVLLPANAHIARPEKTDEAVPGRKVHKVA